MANQILQGIYNGILPRNRALVIVCADMWYI